MSRIGINYLDVTNAISKLQAQSKAITGDNIREVLGTGSKSTITQYLGSNYIFTPFVYSNIPFDIKQ